MTKETKAFEFGPFRLEVRERRLTRDGYSVPLRGRVFDTLLSLVSRHGCLVTKDELMAAVWPDSVVEETNLNHNICVLRRALGEKATGQKYVETIPRQGYRFVAEVRELDKFDESSFSRPWDIQDSVPVAQENGSNLQPSPPESPSLPARPHAAQELFSLAHTRWFDRRGILAFAFMAAFLVLGYNGVERLGLMGNRSHSRVMLAVLPFENLTGDSGQKYIADGLSHEIISELGHWNPAKLGVIARTSSRVYLGVRKSAGEIGHELGVDYIVEGSVRRSDSRFRITVMLIRVDDQAHLWAENYDRTTDNIMAMQIEVSRIIAREVGSRIAVEPGEGSLMAYPASREDCRNVRGRIPSEKFHTTEPTLTSLTE